MRAAVIAWAAVVGWVAWLAYRDSAPVAHYARFEERAARMNGLAS